MNSHLSTMDDNPHPPSQQTLFAGDENQHQPMAGIQNAIIGNTTNPGPVLSVYWWTIANARIYSAQFIFMRGLYWVVKDSSFELLYQAS